ncbi:unnamed protein product, partial [Ixodes hexagonus]
YLEDNCSPLGTPSSYKAVTPLQSISFEATNKVFQPELKEEGCRAGFSFTALNESLGFLVTPVSLDVPRREPGNCSDFLMLEGLADDALSHRRFCGSQFPSAGGLRTAGDTFTIWWFSEPLPGTKRTASFKVVIVAYVNASDFSGDCSYGWRQCGDGACIDPRVWCDGIQNCGDGSDEAPQNCGPSSYRLTVPGIVIITVVVAFAVLAILVVIYVRRRRSAYRAA